MNLPSDSEQEKPDTKGNILQHSADRKYKTGCFVFYQKRLVSAGRSQAGVTVWEDGWRGRGISPRKCCLSPRSGSDEFCVVLTAATRALSSMHIVL